MHVLHSERHRLSSYFARMICSVDAAIQSLGELDMDVPPHQLTAKHSKHFKLSLHAKHLKLQQEKVEDMLGDL